MIGIIREHNILTGYRFVIAEYAIVAGLFGALVAYYLAVGRFLDALTWLGIVVNCILIAALAVCAVRNGGVDFGTLPLRHREFRDRVGREHPHLLGRTLVLITITCVPFLLALVALVERLRRV